MGGTKRNDSSSTSGAAIGSEQSGDEVVNLQENDSVCDVCGSTNAAKVMLQCQNVDNPGVMCPFGRHFFCFLDKQVRLKDTEADVDFYCTSCTSAGYAKAVAQPTERRTTGRKRRGSSKENEEGDGEEEEEEDQEDDEWQEDDLEEDEDAGKEMEDIAPLGAASATQRRALTKEPRPTHYKMGGGGPAAAGRRAPAAAAAGGRGGKRRAAVGSRGGGAGLGALSKYEREKAAEQRSRRGVEATRPGHAGKGLGTLPVEEFGPSPDLPGGSRARGSTGRGDRGVSREGTPTAPAVVQRDNRVAGRGRGGSGRGTFSLLNVDKIFWSGHLELIAIDESGEQETLFKLPAQIERGTVPAGVTADPRALAPFQAALRRTGGSRGGTAQGGGRLVAYIGKALDVGTDFAAALGRTEETLPAFKLAFTGSTAQNAAAALRKLGCSSATYWMALPLAECPHPVLFVVLRTNDFNLMCCQPRNAAITAALFRPLSARFPTLLPLELPLPAHAHHSASAGDRRGPSQSGGPWQQQQHHQHHHQKHHHHHQQQQQHQQRAALHTQRQKLLSQQPSGATTDGTSAMETSAGGTGVAGAAAGTGGTAQNLGARVNEPRVGYRQPSGSSVPHAMKAAQLGQTGNMGDEVNGGPVAAAGAGQRGMPTYEVVDAAEDGECPATDSLSGGNVAGVEGAPPSAGEDEAASTEQLEEGGVGPEADDADGGAPGAGRGGSSVIELLDTTDDDEEKGDAGQRQQWPLPEDVKQEPGVVPLRAEQRQHQPLWDGQDWQQVQGLQPPQEQQQQQEQQAAALAPSGSVRTDPRMDDLMATLLNESRRFQGGAPSGQNPAASQQQQHPIGAQGSVRASTHDRLGSPGVQSPHMTLTHLTPPPRRATATPAIPTSGLGHAMAQPEQEQQQQHPPVVAAAATPASVRRGGGGGRHYARALESCAVQQLLKSSPKGRGALSMAQVMPDLSLLRDAGGGGGGWRPFRVALLGFDEAEPTKKATMERALDECRDLGAQVYSGLAALLAANRHQPRDGAATVLVVPRNMGPADLQRALQHQATALAAAGAGDDAVTRCSAWWQVLTVLSPPLLVFYEGTCEGLLTMCRLWAPDRCPSPAQDAVAWASALRQYQLHACGLTVVAGEAVLQYVPRETASRLLRLLAKGRRSCRGTVGPADWCLALRKRDLGYLTSCRSEVAEVLRLPEHADTMLLLDDLLADASPASLGIDGIDDASDDSNAEGGEEDADASAPGGQDHLGGVHQQDWTGRHGLHGGGPRQTDGSGSGGAARAARGQRRQLLGLSSSEPDEVRDAVTLAWLRRTTVRLVVVLVPDVEDVEGSLAATTPQTPGVITQIGDGSGAAGSGGAAQAGAMAPRGMMMSREHVKVALKVVNAAGRHGSILAGPVSGVMELLQRITTD